MLENFVKQKLSESIKSILPIAAVVLFLGITIAPMSTGTFLLFLLGVLCLIAGLSIFTMGAEMSMLQLGGKIGSYLAKSKSVWLIAFISFIIGILVTVSEPDLQILAEQVSGVDNMLLILTVSLGVGIFLAIALMRIVFRISLSVLLIIFYIAAFSMCFFIPQNFWSVAFDSGGVTTGPMTVPFIMAIGAGVAGARSSDGEHSDSFGLVALCSIGPILAVLILGICFGVNDSNYVADATTIVENTRQGMGLYLYSFAEHTKDVAIALLPTIVFALLFQLFTHAFGTKQLVRIGVGIVYTFVGLVVFLTGANEGFKPAGTELGQTLASLGNGYLLIPVCMLIGYFIVNAEPAVYVLNKQVEQITAGAISASTMRLALSIGVSAALGLAMVRILTGISILWILIPGYVIALGLSFFVPKFFTGIAFDSGGVASGVMMSAFVLPLSIGACSTVGGNIMTQAFGCVAFVALTPIISIQICGLIYSLKSKHAIRRFSTETELFFDYSDSFEQTSVLTRR
ncbi:MAG: DUF1538 domain-containing protein [Clostridia bacterium]|nr:DUF1538 domain-containing protein [Clostridia bacterium]